MTKGVSYIFGAGGHAHVIASFLTSEVCFLVPHEPLSDRQMSQAQFFQRADEFRRSQIYIGVGDNAARKAIFDRLLSVGIEASVCIAPNAFVARDASVSAGAVICAGAVIGARARIGSNTIVNTLSSVDHDCVLGIHSQVTVGVTLCGSVKTGSNCFFGVKSAVIPGRTIGDDVVVMAGSLVTRDVQSSVMVGGSPARVVRAV